MEWDKIWAINKKTIDPVAPRFTAVDGSYSVPVKVAGSDVKVEAATVNKHPKDEAIGTKTVWRSATGKFVLLDFFYFKIRRFYKNVIKKIHNFQRIGTISQNFPIFLQRSSKFRNFHQS